MLAVGISPGLTVRLRRVVTQLPCRDALTRVMTAEQIKRTKVLIKQKKFLHAVEDHMVIIKINTDTLICTALVLSSSV